MSRFLQNFLIIAFIMGWILPVGFYGVTNRTPPWVPEFFAQRANVSRLFYRESPRWWIYEVQFRRKGDVNFQIWQEKDLFSMRPFGYRTRFQRLLGRPSVESKEMLIHRIHQDINQRDPENPVIAMRLVRFPSPMIPNENLTGHFVQPTSVMTEKRAETVDEYIFNQ